MCYSIPDRTFLKFCFEFEMFDSLFSEGTKITFSAFKDPVRNQRNVKMGRSVRSCSKHGTPAILRQTCLFSATALSNTVSKSASVSSSNSCSALGSPSRKGTINYPESPLCLWERLSYRRVTHPSSTLMYLCGIRPLTPPTSPLHQSQEALLWRMRGSPCLKESSAGDLAV